MLMAWVLRPGLLISRSFGSASDGGEGLPHLDSFRPLLVPSRADGVSSLASPPPHINSWRRPGEVNHLFSLKSISFLILRQSFWAKQLETAAHISYPAAIGCWWWFICSLQIAPVGLFGFLDLIPRISNMMPPDVVRLQFPSASASIDNSLGWWEPSTTVTSCITWIC